MNDVTGDDGRTATIHASRQETPGPFEAMVRSHLRAVIVLLIASLVVFGPGFFSLPPMDRDEPRFAQASKQMRESGDLVDIRFQTEARYKKPVGIYWLQALTVAVAESVGVDEARTRIWLYRIPSLIGAVLAVLLAYWAGLPFLSRQGALLAALLLAATILLGVEARLAKTDAVITATVVAAMGVLARAYKGRGEPSGLPAWQAAAFWSAIGCGILVKGPITPMVPAFAAGVLALRARDARWLLRLRPVLGLLICLVIVGPWLAAILFKTGGAFFAESLGKDMLGKVAAGQEAHGAPPGSYLAMFWITGWPLSPFVLLAAPFLWRARRSDAVGFFAAWIIPAWLLFELVPTKLPHYVLPLYPALALAVGYAVDNQALSLARRWRQWVALLVPLIAFLVIVAECAIAVVFGARPGWMGIALALPVLALCGWSVRLIHHRQIAFLIPAALMLAVTVSMLAFGTLLGGGFFAPFALSPRLASARAAATAASPGCQALAPVTAGYREPSLVFLTVTDLAMGEGAVAAAFLAAAPCRIAFVEAREEPAFHRAGGPEVAVARVAGINLNGGKKLDIGVYVRQ